MKKIIWLIIWFIPLVAFSQEKAIFSFHNKLVSEVLFSIEKTFDVRFSYSDIILDTKKISLGEKKRDLTETLSEISSKTRLVFQNLDSRYIIVKKRKKHDQPIVINIKTEHLSEVILNNYLTKGISKNKLGFYNIQSKKLGLLPGLSEGEILESIQQLPSVISPNETTTGLIVRGGTSDQNHFIWDDINMYHNGHLFGMISPFNPQITQNIIFHNKGTNPRYGDRISSVIDIKTNENIAKKLHAKFGINGISSNAFLETPVIKDKLSLQVSARRSYANFLQTPTFKKLADKVFQSTVITDENNASTDFYFVDYNAKLNYQLNQKNKLSFSGIYINNNLDYLKQNKSSNEYMNDLMYIKNRGFSTNLNSKWSKKIHQKTNFSFSEYRFNYNYITKEKVDNTDTFEQISNFNKRNVIFDTNIATEFEVKTKNNQQLNFGYQYNFKDVAYAFLNKKNAVLVLDYDDNQLSTHSGFVNYGFKTPKSWMENPIEIQSGIRANYYKEFGKFKIEPRVVINKNLSKYLKIQLTGELKSQVISQIDETVLSNLSLENRVWRLADNEKFPIINSNQLSAGLLYQKNGWSFDTDFYHKNTDGITALSLGFLNPNGTTFHIGKQKIDGFDFYLKKNFNHFNTWVSYSFTDVKNRFKTLNNNIYFTANSNISHAISTSVSYNLKHFEMALGWKWRTGKPYTKSKLIDDKIQFDGINTENLANYHRLDFSSTYKFNFSKRSKLKGKIGLSIRNFYNQKNQLSREYLGFNDVDDPISIQERFSLGFTSDVSFLVYW